MGVATVDSIPQKFLAGNLLATTNVRDGICTGVRILPSLTH